MKKCINCKTAYEEFMFENYNLGLCKNCFNMFDETTIKRDYSVDKVEHKITCPKCNKNYDCKILDRKCETEDCNVWFFWDNLDCMVFARWIDI